MRCMKFPLLPLPIARTLGRQLLTLGRLGAWAVGRFGCRAVGNRSLHSHQGPLQDIRIAPNGKTLYGVANRRYALGQTGNFR